MRIAKLALLFVVLCLGSAAASADSLAVLNQGNDAYQKEQYAQAAQYYESLANVNRANAAVYYNLGNVYYRMRQPGRAILNYERALRIAPRDQDARFNLDFVNSQLNLPQPASALELLAGWAAALFSLNELAMLASALWIIFCAGMIAYIMRKSYRLLSVNAGIFAALLLFSCWFALKYEREAGAAPRAVVIAGPAEARNGPGMDNSVGFTLPEGRKVIVLGEKGDWAAIGLAEEGLKGWVEKKYLEKI